MTQHHGLRQIHLAGAPVRARGPVVLVCNPADDLEFCRAAEAALTAAPPDADALQRALARQFPRVVVRARGLSNESFDAWYVYRDGRWTPARGSREGVA